MKKTYKDSHKGESVQLQALCESITDCHHSTPTYTADGKLVIRNFNIKNGRLLLNKASFTDDVHFKQRTSRAIPEPGDLIITREAPMGEVCIIPDGIECCLGQRMVLIKPDVNKVDNKFLLYSLLSEYAQIQIGKSNGTGSIVSNLRIPLLKELLIPDIKLGKQRSIGKVLSNIDKKIELNKKINAELEAMAKLIYDYWFVQFDFPDANGKPYKSSGGKMVYNKALKREIPHGWDYEYIENLLAKEPRTKKLPNKQYQDKGFFPVIDQSKSFICGYTDDEDTVIKTNVPRIVFGDHTRILKLVNFDFARGADGTQVLLSNNDNVPQHFFYHSLLKIDLSNYGYARHFKFLKQTKTLVPSADVAFRFEEIVTSFYSQMKHNIFETKELENLRDWLLPVLMNGQVTIKDPQPNES